MAAVDVRKDEVEEKQRERRKELVKLGEEHTPRFFRYDPPHRSSSCGKVAGL